MIRIAFGLLLLLHGLLHLIGFVTAFGLATLPQLSGKTLVALGPAWQRPLGALWLLAALLLVTVAAMAMARMDGWWQAGLAALLLSQALIVLAWPDAKAGTAINVVLLAAIGLGWAQARFERATAREVRAALGQASPTPAAPIKAEDLRHLPAPVMRWLLRAGVVGKPPVRTVLLRQRGQLRTAPDQPFFPAEAEQVFNAESPGFVWGVRATMKHVLPVLGRDSYLRGHGHMRITAAGLFSIADATGPKIDQGTQLRFLGELVWFPSAALAPYLRWQGIDERAAEATMSYRGVTTSARFTFDELGRVTGIAARRYLGDGGAARMESWAVRVAQWQRWGGVEVPSQGTVTWELAGGDFDYYRWVITDLEHDPAPTTVEHMSHHAAAMQHEVVAARG